MIFQYFWPTLADQTVIWHPFKAAKILLLSAKKKKINGVDDGQEDLFLL